MFPTPREQGQSLVLWRVTSLPVLKCGLSIAARRSFVAEAQCRREWTNIQAGGRQSANRPAWRSPILYRAKCEGRSTTKRPLENRGGDRRSQWALVERFESSAAICGSSMRLSAPISQTKRVRGKRLVRAVEGVGGEPRAKADLKIADQDAGVGDATVAGTAESAGRAVPCHPSPSADSVARPATRPHPA